MNMKITDKDRQAYQKVAVALEIIRRQLATQFPENHPSPFQSLYLIAKTSGVSVARIERLIALGQLQTKKSDGHGPFIALNNNA